MNTVVTPGPSHARSTEMLPAGTVARRLGVCRKTVNRWCAGGAIRGALRTPGGHWRVPRAEVERICGASPSQAHAA